MRKGKYAKRGMAGKTLVLVLALVMLIGGTVGGTLAWLMDKSETVTNTFTDSDIEIELKEHEYDPVNDVLTGVETEAGVSNYKMIPGWAIPKDPWAKVSADSEDCYLFIEVEEKGGNVTVDNVKHTFDSFIAYAIDAGWTELDATAYPGVYYQVIDTTAEKGVNRNILGAGSYTYDEVDYTWTEKNVLTKPEVTKQMMDAFDADKNGSLDENEKKNLPTLSFTAYAVQLWKTNKSADDSTTTDVNEAQFTATEAWEKAAAMKDA